MKQVKVAQFSNGLVPSAGLGFLVPKTLWLLHRYSRILYDAARTTGLTNGYGFASGIFENTLKATVHADVNTNGIILESILYILSGSKPAITLQSS